jgi:hypothetical protein
MLRVLVLVAAFLFIRTVISDKRRRSSMAMSPYMNSLDGSMSAEQISQALDDLAPLPENSLLRRSRLKPL